MLSLRFALVLAVLVTNGVNGFYAIPYGFDTPYKPYPGLDSDEITTPIDDSITTTEPPVEQVISTTEVVTPPPVTMPPIVPETTPVPEVTTPPPPPPISTTEPIVTQTPKVCTKCNKSQTTTPPTSSEDKFSIKYYRQYNYYYPSDSKILHPIQKPTKPNVIGQTVIIKSVSNPVGDSNKAKPNIYRDSRVMVQTINPSNTKTIAGDLTYLPNQYVWSSSGLRLHQSAPLQEPTPIPVEEEQEELPTDEPVDEPSVPTDPPAPVDEPVVPKEVPEDSVQKEILGYLSDEASYGQSSLAQQINRSLGLSVGSIQSSVNWQGATVSTPTVLNPIVNPLRPNNAWYNPWYGYQYPQTQPVYSVTM